MKTRASPGRERVPSGSFRLVLRGLQALLDPFEDGELSGWIELPAVGAWGLSSARARSGTSSIEVGNVYNEPGSSNYMIADVPSTADLAVDAWWNVSAVPVDIAVILRCQASLPMSNVQANYDTGDEWHLARNTGGVWNSLATSTMSLPIGRWFKVTVAMVGGAMRLLADDVRMRKAANPEPAVRLGNEVCAD